MKHLRQVCIIILCLLCTISINAKVATAQVNTEIVFVGQDGGIYIMNSDGSGEIQVASNTLAHQVLWSPDGTKIAFTSGADGHDTEIYIMNADGSNQSRLTNNDAVDAEIA